MWNTLIEQPPQVTMRDTVTFRPLNRHSILLCYSWLNSLLDCHVSLLRANRLQSSMVLDSD